MGLTCEVKQSWCFRPSQPLQLHQGDSSRIKSSMKRIIIRRMVRLSNQTKNKNKTNQKTHQIHLLNCSFLFYKQLLTFQPQNNTRFVLCQKTIIIHSLCHGSSWYNRTGWLGVKHQLTNSAMEWQTQPNSSLAWEHSLSLLIFDWFLLFSC